MEHTHVYISTYVHTYVHIQKISAEVRKKPVSLQYSCPFVSQLEAQLRHAEQMSTSAPSTHIFVQPKILNQCDEEGRMVVIPSNQLESCSLGLASLREVSHPDYLVNGLLSHGAISCPLPSSNGDEIRGADVNDVVAGNGLGVPGLWVTDQRANAAPRSKHVTSTHCGMGWGGKKGRSNSNASHNPVLSAENAITGSHTIPSRSS